MPQTIADLNIEAPHEYCSICRTRHHPNWHQPEWRIATWDALDAARSRGDISQVAKIRVALHHAPRQRL